MIEGILCQTKSRTRSIVNLCEQSGYWRTTQKGPIRTHLHKKIVNDWAIFEANEKPDAQHSKPMWAIGLLKSDSKRANQNQPTQKIVNDWGNFLPNKKPDAQHSRPMWATRLLQIRAKFTRQNDFLEWEFCADEDWSWEWWAVDITRITILVTVEIILVWVEDVANTRI